MYEELLNIPDHKPEMSTNLPVVQREDKKFIRSNLKRLNLTKFIAL